MSCTGCGTPLVPNSGFCGACGARQTQHQQQYAQQPPYAYPQHPHAQPQQPYGYGPPPLIPHPLVLQRGPFTRLTGHMFVAPQRLFFICASDKGGWGVALGVGVGGLIGGVIAAVAAPSLGQAPIIDEPTLFRAAYEMPGSMIMEPARFKAIKYTMWTRGIFYDGTTYALREGLTKELRHELGLWARANGVKHAGLGQ